MKLLFNNNIETFVFYALHDINVDAYACIMTLMKEHTLTHYLYEYIQKTESSYISKLTKPPHTVIFIT